MNLIRFLSVLLILQVPALASEDCEHNKYQDAEGKNLCAFEIKNKDKCKGTEANRDGDPPKNLAWVNGECFTPDAANHNSKAERECTAASERALRCCSGALTCVSGSPYLMIVDTLGAQALTASDQVIGSKITETKEDEREKIKKQEHLAYARGGLSAAQGLACQTSVIMCFNSCSIENVISSGSNAAISQGSKSCQFHQLRIAKFLAESTSAFLTANGFRKSRKNLEDGVVVEEKEFCEKAQFKDTYFCTHIADESNKDIVSVDTLSDSQASSGALNEGQSAADALIPKANQKPLLSAPKSPGSVGGSPTSRQAASVSSGGGGSNNQNTRGAPPVSQAPPFASDNTDDLGSFLKTSGGGGRFLSSSSAEKADGSKPKRLRKKKKLSRKKRIRKLKTDLHSLFSRNTRTIAAKEENIFKIINKAYIDLCSIHALEKCK